MALNYANGIMPIAPLEGQYTCHVNKYNNPNLIRKVLRKRPWWKEVTYQDEAQINFTWVQFTIRPFLQKIPKHGKQLPKTFMPPLGGITQKEVIKLFPLLSGILSDHEHANFARCYRHLETAILVTMEDNDKSSHHVLPDYFSGQLQVRDPRKTVMQNKLEMNIQYGYKSSMYLNLSAYCKANSLNILNMIPETFYISPSTSDSLAKLKLVVENDHRHKSLWIVKPAENTFGGCGIKICKTMEEINQAIGSEFVIGEKPVVCRRYVVQAYIRNPFLYKGRKFDIRCFMLITSVNGRLKAFWYSEGYLRTASQPFDLISVQDPGKHLTNDCMQKKIAGYGTFEKSNKLLYHEFEEYLISTGYDSNILRSKIVPRMRDISTVLIKATCSKIDPHRRQQTFELIGLDFMIDEHFNCYLLEANNSPSLVKSDHQGLNTLLENLIEETFQLAVDPLFPPPAKYEGNLAFSPRGYSLVFSDNRLHERLPPIGLTKPRIAVSRK